MNIKSAAGFTVAQIRAMSQEQYNALQMNLEDENHHTAVVMTLAARNNCGKVVKALEALDDLHMAIGHMPMEAIALREALRKQVTVKSW